MRRYRTDILCLLLLFGCIIIFFARLFYPIPQLYVTPGYTNSDILHLNYPIKELLSQSFKHFSLPVWSDAIGTGFPLIGESQIQAFSLVNIFLFTLFPMPLAFNLGYIVSFLIFSFGMYLIAKQEGFSPVTAFFCTFIFTFSGFNIVRVQHYNILSIFCYMPLIFLAIRHLLMYPKSYIWLLLPLLLSQTILSGHLPTVFSLFVFFGFLAITRWYIHKHEHIPKQLYFKGILIIILSLGLSCIQLVPTFEFFAQSSRGQTIKLFDTPRQGLTLKNLALFVLPYHFGDIRNGTYRPTPQEQNYWEVINYIGVLPLLLSLMSLFYIKRNRRVLAYWILIGALFFLALEGNSPLLAIYAVPPLSWFRVYTRLLVFGFFLLTLLAGYMLETLRIRLKKKFMLRIVITVSIVLVSILDVWKFSVSYNPLQQTNQILKPPKTAQYLQSVHPQRIYSLGGETLWRSTFTSYGWKQPNRYMYLTNTLSPNINMLYNIAQAAVYSGFILRKQSAISALVYSNVDTDPEKNTTSLSPVGTTMLKLLGADYVISPFQLTNFEFTRVFTATSPYIDIPSINVYHLKSAKPLYYIAHSVSTLTGLRELEINLRDPTWADKYDAIVDGGPSLPQIETSSDDRIEKMIYSDTKKQFTYSTTKNGYFILSTYLYPGWQARLDGKKVRIYNANIYAMGIATPKGTHKVEFTFVPMSLYVGAAISTVTLLFYVAIVIGFVYRKRA